jgi:hypothetical protein
MGKIYKFISEKVPELHKEVKIFVPKITPDPYTDKNRKLKTKGDFIKSKFCCEKDKSNFLDNQRKRKYLYQVISKQGVRCISQYYKEKDYFFTFNVTENLTEGQVTRLMENLYKNQSNISRKEFQEVLELCFGFFGYIKENETDSVFEKSLKEFQEIHLPKIEKCNIVLVRDRETDEEMYYSLERKNFVLNNSSRPPINNSLEIVIKSSKKGLIQNFYKCFLNIHDISEFQPNRQYEICENFLNVNSGLPYNSIFILNALLERSNEKKKINYLKNLKIKYCRNVEEYFSVGDQIQYWTKSAITNYIERDEWYCHTNDKVTLREFANTLVTSFQIPSKLTSKFIEIVMNVQEKQIENSKKDITSYLKSIGYSVETEKNIDKTIIEQPDLVMDFGTPLIIKGYD